MALELDGFAALRAIAGRPEAFACLADDASKVALGLLTKALKDKRTTVGAARVMAEALPDGAFAHVTDAMKDAEVCAVASRLDANDPSLKAAGRMAQAVRIEEILTGDREPVAKAMRAARAKAPAAPKRKAGIDRGLKVLRSKAMTAVREDA